MADSPLRGSSGLDIDRAVKHLDDNAGAVSSSRCALFVRNALGAGGVFMNPHPRDAKDYGSYLLAKGFVQLDTTRDTPQKGDIAVIQNYEGGSAAGHITMFDGTKWVSDFTQTDMWSGPGYRTKKPAYALYRP